MLGCWDGKMAWGLEHGAWGMEHGAKHRGMAEGGQIVLRKLPANFLSQGMYYSSAEICEISGHNLFFIGCRYICGQEKSSIV